MERDYQSYYKLDAENSDSSRSGSVSGSPRPGLIPSQLPSNEAPPSSSANWSTFQELSNESFGVEMEMLQPMSSSELHSQLPDVSIVNIPDPPSLRLNQAEDLGPFATSHVPSSSSHGRNLDFDDYLQPGGPGVSVYPLPGHLILPLCSTQGSQSLPQFRAFAHASPSVHQPSFTAGFFGALPGVPPPSAILNSTHHQRQNSQPGYQRQSGLNHLTPPTGSGSLSPSYFQHPVRSYMPLPQFFPIPPFSLPNHSYHPYVSPLGLLPQMHPQNTLRLSKSAPGGSNYIGTSNPFSIGDQSSPGNVSSGEYGYYRSEPYPPKDKDDEIRHICKICLKTFGSIKDLKVHLSVHSGQRIYKCHECPKSFKKPSQLDIHQRIHTDVHPYECNLCPKKFKSLFGINQHKLMHAGVKPYSCDLCALKFRQRIHVTVHKRRYHNTQSASQVAMHDRSNDF